MNILTVVGARPQLIKCASLSRKLRQSHTEIFIHTGQHYDQNMSDIFFKELGIPEPTYNLGIGSGTHGEQTGKMLCMIEKILIKEKPDIVLVYGDTNSTITGSLAASKLHIPVAHVEAGLRSFDKTMPEEINRILTDHVSDVLLCPTKTAVNNLKNEGITEGVYNVGDVMMDALQYNIGIAEKKSKILEILDLQPKEFMIATLHRASNTDNIENLSATINALCDADANIIFPVHPRTEKYLKQYKLWDKANKSLTLIPPLGYLDMLKLMSNAKKILTDSGGVQKEAYMLKIPCITMRDSTEWIETVETGWNLLVGTAYEKIIHAIVNFGCPTKWEALYGDGDASEQIVTLINNNIF